MTRALFAFCLAGTLAACSGSGGPTTSHRDAAVGHDASDALMETAYLTGTITSTDDPCLTARIVSPGGNPACTLIEHLSTDAGAVMNVPVESCTDSLGPPCFSIQAMNGCAMTFAILQTSSPSASTTFSYSCQLCPQTGPQPDGR